MSKVRKQKRSRLPDWEARLFTYLNSMQKAELVFGQEDCVVGLAAGAVEAQTGVDLAAAFRGKYKDERSALKLMIKQGWTAKTNGIQAALVDMMDTHLQRAPKNNRHRGNIVLLETEMGPAFGVRVGTGIVGFSEGGGTRIFKAPKGHFYEWVVI